MEKHGVEKREVTFNSLAHVRQRTGVSKMPTSFKGKVVNFSG